MEIKNCQILGNITRWSLALVDFASNNLQQVSIKLY